MHRLRGFGGGGAAFGLVLGLALGVGVVVVVDRDGGSGHAVRNAAQPIGLAPPAVTSSRDLSPSSSAGARQGGEHERADPAAVVAGGDRRTSGKRGGGAGVRASETVVRPQPRRAVAVRGVSDRAIKIGIALLDLGPLAYLGPAYDHGDPEEQWRALLDGWRRRGLLPIHGRDITPVFRHYSVLSPEQQRATCVRFAQDDEVFMVIGVAFFQIGAECLAREARIPVLTFDGPPEDVFARSHPHLFSIAMSDSRLLRNWIHWAHHRGLLSGEKIGLYYGSDQATRELVAQTVKRQVGLLGYEIAAEVTTDSGRGGPTDAIAVQRFKAAGVTLAMVLTSKTGFMQQAEAQGYRPEYIETDYQFGTRDTTASTHPPAQFDGTLGMSGDRAGEVAAGLPQSAETRECLSNYRRFSKRKEPVPDGSEYSFILYSCDEGKVLMHGLRGAGRDLTPLGFIAALESIRALPMTRYAAVTYTPTKHHGGDQQRTKRWFKECRCWRAHGAFEPLWVS